MVTVSDRASRGEYEDRSGPAAEQALAGALPGCEIDRLVVPDERRPLLLSLEQGLAYDAVVTTGGTGLGPRDITPEVTEEFCEREIPGIAEYLRSESLKETGLAPLSRGYAGLRGSTVIVNLPGSTAGARSTASLVAPLLEHATAMISGRGHE